MKQKRLVPKDVAAMLMGSGKYVKQDFRTWTWTKQDELPKNLFATLKALEFKKKENQYEGPYGVVRIDIESNRVTFTAQLVNK